MDHNKEHPFGDALRGLRRSAGMTLLDVGTIWGVSVSYVCDVERGRRSPPSSDRIVKLLSKCDRMGELDRLQELALAQLPTFERVTTDAAERKVLVALNRELDSPNRDQVLRRLFEVLEHLSDPVAQEQPNA